MIDGDCDNDDENDKGQNKHAAALDDHHGECDWQIVDYDIGNLWWQWQS